MEGFPNIFIEAWACGIPVLSLSFDPGDVIAKEGLGEVAKGDIDELVKDMQNVEDSEEFAIKAKEYVEQNHVINDKKIAEISSLFTSLYNSKK
jgi:glycosyltransferase involved in cell wall biosynthesis